MKLNPGLAACRNESQTLETGAGEEESDLFECQHLEKGERGDFCPQKPILASPIKAAIVIGSWWEFRRGKLCRESADT